MSDTFSDDHSRFYHAYGRALAFWAEAEADLGDHFRRITGLTTEVGSAVYYSARSFLGRVDMLSAVVPFAKTVPEGKQFLVRAVNLSRGWAGARNRLAHDLHYIDILSNRQLKPVLYSATGEITTIEQIENAGSNFYQLGEILRISQGSKRLLREPELCLVLLNQLTTDPLASAADRLIAEPLLEQISLSED